MPTKPFARNAAATILIYTERPSTDPTKPPEVLTLAEIGVPLSWLNILVLMHLDENSGQYSLVPINQSFSALPPASVSFYNLTRNPLAIKMGSSQGLVESNKSLVLPVGLSGEAAAMVQIQVAAEIEGQAKILASTAAALTPHDRRIVLLAPGQNRPLRLSILDATPPDPEAPVTAAHPPLVK